jgi:hypothetical protein
MTPREQFLKLQWAQLKHDESYHKDVVIMPLAERIKHMALHNAKYTAYFFDAIDETGDAKLTKTLVDAFVIVLACANTLNQDIGVDLGAEAEKRVSFQSLGATLGETIGRDEADRYWFVRNFARHTGRLAKVCESWDHMESIVFRDEMRQCNLELLRIILAEAGARQLDLAESYRSRMRQVEGRSIFDKLFQEGAGGEA